MCVCVCVCVCVLFMHVHVLCMSSSKYLRSMCVVCLSYDVFVFRLRVILSACVCFVHSFVCACFTRCMYRTSDSVSTACPVCE